MSNICHHIFITGPPGCGKTTFIKKVYRELKQNKIPCDGFITEELRENNVRYGFDVIPIDGIDSSKRYPLARIADSPSPVAINGPLVGRYVVHIQSFESVIRPIFGTMAQGKKVLIIDEIGKMESFSEYFTKKITQLYKSKPGYLILASIPVDTRPLPYLAFLCQLPSAEIFTINRGNRDLLVDQVSKNIVQMYSSVKKK